MCGFVRIKKVCKCVDRLSGNINENMAISGRYSKIEAYNKKQFSFIYSPIFGNFNIYFETLFGNVVHLDQTMAPLVLNTHSPAGKKGQIYWTKLKQLSPTKLSIPASRMANS
jgi:hypothetical protein